MFQNTLVHIMCNNPNTHCPFKYNLKHTTIKYQKKNSVRMEKNYIK